MPRPLELSLGIRVDGKLTGLDSVSYPLGGGTGVPELLLKSEKEVEF